MQDPKSPSRGTIPQICRALSSQLRHVSTIEKIIKQQCFPHMSSQCGELRPTSGWDLLVSLRHPCEFQRFRVLAVLLHGSLVMGISQTLRRWTKGATYIRPAGHHVGHWPTFLVLSFSSPNLSRRRLDVYDTSTHDVVLARILDAGLKPAERGWLKIQKKSRPKFAICASSHNFVALCLCN